MFLSLIREIRGFFYYTYIDQFYLIYGWAILICTYNFPVYQQTKSKILSKLFIQMINVYSFQKMIQNEESHEDKNISKTSQFIFGQNYKKMIANSKANFDFRRFLQKHSNTKKHFATINPKETAKRSPLEQVNPFDVMNTNNPNNIQSKAFKIRCYSRKTQQKENEKQQQVTVSKLFKHKPRIYPMKQVRVEQRQRRAKTNIDFKKCIRMHKMDNFQELQSIANSIRVFYNKNESDLQSKNTQKAIVMDMNYLVSCIKSTSTKMSDKDKEHEYFVKKIVFFIKKIIEDKYMSYPLDNDGKDQRPQIMFKLRNQDEVANLIKVFEQCQFTAYYCMFYPLYKCVQSISIYSLTKIHNLAQNITLVDSLENLMNHAPLLNSRHFIAFATFSQKANFGLTLESLFHQNQHLQIRFSAEEFEAEQPQTGSIVQIPYKQLLQKVKQKKTLKQCKKSSRQKKQRCHSSYQGTHAISKTQTLNLQNFKDKMLKYLKIIGNQTNLQSKRSRHLSNGNSQDLECITGRQKTSKTNNQIVSQLLKLNCHVHKQIAGFQKKVEKLRFNEIEDVNEMAGYFRFDKVFVNTLH